jgi:hypothetical protein
MEFIEPLPTSEHPLTRAEVEELLRTPLAPMSLEVRRRHFPRLVLPGSSNDIFLPVRIHNCLRHLKESRGITDLSQLHRLRIGELLKLQNFGRKSLIDILLIVSPFIADEIYPPTASRGDHAVADSPLTRPEVEHLLQSPQMLARYEIRVRHLPRIAPSVRPKDISIPVRVQNGLLRLKHSHGITELNHLERLTIGELLKLKNFGPTSLINLLSAILPAILDDNRQTNSNLSGDRQSISSSVTAAAERLRAQPSSPRILCTDPRLKPEVATLLYAANACSDDPPLSTTASLHGVAHRLVGRARDYLPPEKIISTIKRLRYKIARIRKLPLERELKEITEAFAKGRNVEIILGLLGWDGTGPKTLQLVGDQFQITRERIRQISDKCIVQIEETHPFSPCLKRAIVHISKRVPAAADELEEELNKLGITKSLFRLDGVVEASRILGYPIPFQIEEHLGIRTAIHHEDVGLSKSILQLTKRVISHAGLGKVGDIHDLLQKQHSSSFDSSVVEGALQSLASVHWLDERKEWFFLDDLPRNHLITIVRKILGIAPRIHVNEMRAAISGDFRGMGFAPPKAVVLEFCKVACNCTIEGDTIIAVAQPSLPEVLSKLEQTVYDVLTEHGPLLHRTQFERRCKEKGMNPNTFANYVAKLPILARYGQGVYGLRGATVTPGDVERCIPPATKRLNDHGWTEHARPWIAVELSDASVSSGIIHIPTGFERFVAGRFLLKTQDGSEVGNLVVSRNACWGLRPLFMKKGGEPGDVVVLTFDLKRREANVRVGTKEDEFATEERL